MSTNELADLILNCFPKRYEDQYYLNSGTVSEQLNLLRNKMTHKLNEYWIVLKSAPRLPLVRTSKRQHLVKILLQLSKMAKLRIRRSQR